MNVTNVNTCGSDRRQQPTAQSATLEGGMLGSLVVDSRVPEDELWFISGPHQIATLPSGKTLLREPDVKIVNIGQPKSKLDWVIAPH